MRTLSAFFLLTAATTCTAFTVSPLHSPITSSSSRRYSSTLSQQQQVLYNQLVPVPREQEDIPIAFLEHGSSTSYIECFADCTCTLLDDDQATTTYTIGVPCDTTVALCYSSSSNSEEEEQLIPISMDDTKRMDDVFPVAKAIVAEEFGDELSLERTPQTLTLVGELDDDFDEEEEDDEEVGEAEEAVEVLLSFDHRDVDYHLVRILDPVLIVGKEDKTDETGMERRILLTLEESQKVMPTLERLFLEYSEQRAEEEDDNDDEEYDEDDIVASDDFADIDDFTVLNP